MLSPPNSVALNGERTKLSFLDLDVDIRLQIYGLLLIHQQNPKTARWYHIREDCGKMVMLSARRGTPYHQIIGSGILRTCKQIYYEGQSMLYSRNVFAAWDPNAVFQFSKSIGPANFRFVKKLTIIIVGTWCPPLAQCLQLLRMLAEEACGLRCFGIIFKEHRVQTLRGSGHDQEFMAALVSIHGLEILSLTGDYAKH
jgi:hypothetical protein